MIEVDYLLTIGPRFMEIIAHELSMGYGERVTIENNSLKFPPGLAKGRFEYYSLSSDLSMFLIDCDFFEKVKFKRLPVLMNYFHELSFNLSDLPYILELNDVSENIKLENCWQKKIQYSTSGQGINLVVPKDSHIRMILLYFTRSWLLKYYRIDDVPANMPNAKELAEDYPFRFRLDLDLELLLRTQEILDSPSPKYMANLYYEGCAKILLSLVALRLAGTKQEDTPFNYEEVMRLMAIERQIEKKLDQPLPSLEELARKCFMSKSKFEKLFKSVYQKNYTDYFNNAKMKEAAELLFQHWDIEAVAHKLGYNSTNYFARVFKNYYQTTPKVYQQKIKNKLI